VGFGDGPEAVPASIYYGPDSPFAGQDDIIVPVFHSEFGAYPDIYHLSLRYFF
jgi:hypothetical protein